MNDKRRFERMEEENEVVITVISDKKDLSEEEIFYTCTKDISAGGARIRTNIILPVGSYLKVDLKLKDLQDKITALGKVKWIKIVIEDEGYEAGVEFVNKSDDAIKVIWEYIFWKQNLSEP